MYALAHKKLQMKLNFVCTVKIAILCITFNFRHIVQLISKQVLVYLQLGR